MQTVTRQGQCQQPKVEEAGGFFLNKKKFKGKKKKTTKNLAVQKECKPCGNV